MMITIALLVGVAGGGMLLVARFLRRRTRSVPEHPVDVADLNAEVLSTAAGQGDVAAVRIYRRRTGAGLREARDAVDRIVRENRDVEPH
ncbi:MULTISPECIES: hypothetical protein [Actinoplanes]|uniref:hypothetical protein n=1 Tax=Actinoplanes TaxID=1865 RepID=UPI000A75630D|nr:MULTISPECIES: hypothetical protein [Actinoplanes]GLY02325.1 hypothetical protein Acsp01_27040 [Actinoplanes sp. NBRC 101535]